MESYSTNTAKIENRISELDAFFDFLLEHHGSDDEFEKIKPLYNRKFEEYQKLKQKLRVYNVQ